MPAPVNLGPVFDYWDDAWQRSVLFLDVLRQRGNIYREQQAKEVPNVLDFEAELILDGRALKRPVNYLLVRIPPPDGIETDPEMRPFVVVDPRAGHGPGIGGMKEESEIGAALQHGHPCYFVGFLPEPVADQTIEDIWNAQAAFVAEVARRHPATGRPVVIANCQAGWQTMIMAATHPDVAGPLLLAGSPLSFWAGIRGQHPMRYLGGMLGGTWLTRLAGDLGGGIFDGANLVSNFEKLNPANTLFDKPYNVYAKVDTETQRFLDFETWWGSPVLLNAGEMQWMADNLFVGNKLTKAELRTSEGMQIDLRNITSPIIVFCSWGDDITPPQQALGWITDLYRSDDDLVANGQTIVYALHENIGHLGIFVSGKIAMREHREFASAMEMIDLMPPGLYEAVIEEVDETTPNRGLIDNRLFRLERRTLDDIRRLGGNSVEDDLEFTAVDRLSTINSRIYEACFAPSLRAMTPPGFGEWIRSIHPNRLRFSILSDENPGMQLLAQTAERVRKDRRPAADGNPLRAGEQAMAGLISASLTAIGNARDAMVERSFHATYGSPLLQALVGLDPKAGAEKARPAREAVREQLHASERNALEDRFEEGGTFEAALRSLIHIAQGDGSADERAFTVVKALRDNQPPGRPRSLGELKQAFRVQSLLLRLDEKRAVEAIATLLRRDPEEKARALKIVQLVVAARGGLSAEGRRRLARIEALFGQRAKAASLKEPGNADA